MVNVVLFIHFCSILRMIGFITALVGGSNKISPKTSDKNPGESSMTPPIRIQTPLSISSPGSLPYCSCSCTFLKVFMPCFLARYDPSTPVMIRSAIVGQIPITLPERRRTPISAAGIKINNRINTLIRFLHSPLLFKQKLRKGIISLPHSLIIAHLHVHYR